MGKIQFKQDVNSLKFIPTVRRHSTNSRKNERKTKQPSPISEEKKNFAKSIALSEEVTQTLRDMSVVEVNEAVVEIQKPKASFKDIARLQLALDYYGVEKESDWERIAISMNNVFDADTCKNLAIERLNWTSPKKVAPKPEFSWKDLSSRPGTLSHFKTYERLSRDYILTGGCDDYFTGEKTIIEDSKDILSMYDLSDSLTDILMPLKKENPALTSEKLNVYTIHDDLYQKLEFQSSERSQSYPELSSPNVLSEKKRDSIAALNWHYLKMRPQRRSISEPPTSIPVNFDISHSKSIFI